MKRLTELEKLENQIQVGTLTIIMLFCIAIILIVLLLS